MPGLTFVESRSFVLQSFQHTIENCESTKKTRQCLQSEWSFKSFYIWNSFLIIVLLCISSINTNDSYDRYPGIFVSCFVVLAQFILNIIILLRFNHSSDVEVIMNLKKIYADYDRYLVNECELKDLSGTSYPSFNTNPEIKAGHAHISVVSCFRNNKWHRIPTLLLAKGDIIALQCGDITPGQCFELDRQSLADIFPTSSVSNLSTHNGSSTNHSTTNTIPSGTILEKGTKVYYSKLKATNHNNKAPYSYQRHKSLAADSLELLNLSGDMRCFQMSSTPLESFIGDLLTAHAHEDKIKRQSLIRVILIDVFQKGYLVMVLLVILMIISAIIRLSLETESRNYWDFAITLPLASILICCTPLFLPIFLLVSESLLTANFLAITEVLLISENEKMKQAVAKLLKSEAAEDQHDGFGDDDNKNRDLKLWKHRSLRSSLQTSRHRTAAAMNQSASSHVHNNQTSSTNMHQHQAVSEGM